MSKIRIIHLIYSFMINIPPYLLLSFKGQEPGFNLNAGIPYIPYPGSFLINNGTNNVPKPVRYVPKPYGGGLRRPRDNHMDIGAFEFGMSYKRGSTKKKR